MNEIDKNKRKMTKYNPDVHHRRTIRLQGYDYSQAGMYFVTICTQNRECLFGEIVDGEMILNDTGKMAETYWDEIPQRFEYVTLGEFVVMPNHIHGIIIIDGRGGDLSRPQNTNNDNIGAINRAPTMTGGFAKTKNPMLNNNLSRILRWYKGRTTFECHKIIPAFEWQRNYYEHIIRDVQSYNTITEYILNNPKCWNIDKFFENE